MVVGYDATTSSEEALRWAADEAGQRDVHLRIMSCFDMPTAADAVVGFGYAEAILLIERTTERRLEPVVAAMEATHPTLSITTMVAPGPAWEVLCSRLDPGDLVVVGIERRRHRGPFRLGSTVRHLVRHSDCPVVVVHGPTSRGRPDRVVVGVDGPRAAGDALEWARAESERWSVELVVMSTWTSNDLLGAVRDGDLVVVGSHHRRGITRAVDAPAVEDLLERAAVPVVVVPVSGA